MLRRFFWLFRSAVSLATVDFLEEAGEAELDQLVQTLALVHELRELRNGLSAEQVEQIAAFKVEGRNGVFDLASEVLLELGVQQEQDRCG